MLEQLLALFKSLRDEKREAYRRVLPFGDYVSDRWEKAAYLGFGKGTSVYDNVLVIGDVRVGENTWIGPNVVLDGSGGLVIGSFCSISAGAQVYTHDTVDWSITGGEAAYSYAPTVIGNRCYIGPNAIVQKGVTIGDGVIVGANSFVNRSVPSGAKAFGTPVRIALPEDGMPEPAAS
jgi:acetyltransferase-like isoleucine patch superfamily enzyme